MVDFTGRDVIKCVSAMQQQLLSGILVSCTCGKRVSNRNFPAHARGECNTGATVSVQCTLCDLLSQSQDYPLMLKKASPDEVDAFQAYTIRNLDNKVSTSSDIEQYKLLHVTEEPVASRCDVLPCAVPQWELWRVPSS